MGIFVYANIRINANIELMGILTFRAESDAWGFRIQPYSYFYGNIAPKKLRINENGVYL